jgi:DMSO/TMAO reductase YedYZ molybdopterin-dependent catalytic subunit
VFGAVAEEVTWDWDAFNALPQVEITSDFHCVTRWSQLDNTWTGISISEVVNHIQILADARYVTVHAHGHYTTNLPLADLLDEEVLFAHSWNGKPLTPEHGGPMRLVVPKLYAWKSAKWVEALEFMTHDRRGFWEEAGYHDRGDPWKEQRFN